MSAIDAGKVRAAAEADDLLAPKPAGEGLAGRVARIAVPAAMLVLLIVAWQVYVTVAHVPHYILPSPVRIARPSSPTGRSSARRSSSR